MTASDRSGSSTDIGEVRGFWEHHPVAAAAIGASLGSAEYFQSFDILREDVEPAWFRELFYGFSNYAGQQVLDVGCGNGYILSHFARGGASVSGVDLTAQGIRLSRQRFALANLQGKFAQSNAERLPFQDASFDLVTSMGVLHHTPRPDNGIDEIYRVLKPGGRFLIMMYHRNSLLYRLKFPLLRAFRPSLRDKDMQAIVNLVDGADNPLGRVYSKQELHDLLHRFTAVESVAGSLEASHFGHERLGRLLPGSVRKWLSRHLGWFLYAQATKPT